MCLIRREVCCAIVKELLPKYIKVPFGSKLTSVLNGFAKRGFPHCGGAIDGTHIPIEAPQDSPSDYYNRKGWHSVILEAMVDDRANFTDIHVGYPGRVCRTAFAIPTQKRSEGSGVRRPRGRVLFALHVRFTHCPQKVEPPCEALIQH